MPNARAYMPASVDPSEANMWQAQADFNADNIAIVIDRANVTPAPTSAVWTYSVPFRIVGVTSGAVVPYTGTVAASASDTSTAGTASVPAATVAVNMGHGTATLNGDAQAWLNSETATLVLTLGKIHSVADFTDSFVVTFTS